MKETSFNGVDTSVAVREPKLFRNNEQLNKVSFSLTIQLKRFTLLKREPCVVK